MLLPQEPTASKKSFVGLWASAFFLATIFGLLLALEIYPVAAILAVFLVGPLLIVYPRFGLWVAIIGALVVSGLIDLYLPSLRPLKWGLAILSLGLAVIAMSMSSLGKLSNKAGRTENPTVALWAFGFFLCAVFSSLVNWHGISGVAVGLKGYFQVWGLLIAIYYLVDDEIDAGRLMRFLLLLGLIQLPFVFHQFFVLVPKRSGLLAAEHGVVAVDVVGGTFGGSMNGGGRSSSLALLVAISITIIFARWRSGLMKLGRVFVFGVLLLLPLLLNEAKIIVVLLPMAFYLLFRDRVLRNPLKAMAGLGAIGLLLAVIFTAYLMLPGAKSQYKSSLDDMFRESVDYNIGQRGYGNLLLNRSTVYSFWIKEHAHGDTLASILIGHGPGATNEGSSVLEDSLASKRYRGYGIGLTGISALLWEVGLLGTAVALAMLFSAYRLGGRLAKRWEGTAHWAQLKAAQIAMPLFAASLTHNNFFVVDLSFQALLIVILGYLLVMTRIHRMPA